MGVIDLDSVASLDPRCLIGRIYVVEQYMLLHTKYTQKKKFSQYLCFLIKSTILHISLSNFLHELYYRNFTFTRSLRDK